MKDENKTKEQLLDDLALMRRALARLETKATECTWAEEALRERVKELNCLYSMADIIERHDTVREIFQKTADLLPSGFYYPEYACARITYGNKEFKSGNFKPTKWIFSAEMIVHGGPTTTVEVGYLKKMPDRDEGPFLAEERKLIDAVAERLGRVAERKRVETEAKRYEMRLESLLRISQHPADSVHGLLDFALNEATTLTGSKIGYIYHYDDVKREFILNSWSKEVMQECTIREEQTVYELDRTGVWGEAVRQGKPVVMNDFDAPNPLKKGYPEGHARLFRFLTIPVIMDKRIVAVIGVANKDTDYDETDIRQLTMLMSAVWQITERRRAEQERERLIAELKDALSQIKTLSGLLPICASCKKIRDDGGYWTQIESYISSHSQAEFTHGICPECREKLYPKVTARP